MRIYAPTISISSSATAHFHFSEDASGKSVIYVSSEFCFVLIFFKTSLGIAHFMDKIECKRLFTGRLFIKQ